MTNHKILGGMIHHLRSSHNAMKTATMQLLLHFASPRLPGNDLPPPQMAHSHPVCSNTNEKHQSFLCM